MEEETYFLFVIWHEKNLPAAVTPDLKNYIYGKEIEIKKICRQKAPREGELYRRIPVDIDPLFFQSCYLISCWFLSEFDLDGRITKVFEPCYVAKDEEEALLIKKGLEDGRYKKFLPNKKYTLEKVTAIQYNVVTK